MTKPVDVDEKGFDKMLAEAKGPVLVDFWAPWCGPCRMVAPVVEELAQEYTGKVDFVKLNVDENPAVATRYGIRGIPTLLIFRGGQLAQQVVGFRPKKELKKVLDEVLA